MWTRWLVPFAIIVVAAACGGDSQSTTAASSLNLNGSWAGTWQFQTNGLTVTDTITATVAPYLSQATVSWQASGGPTGSFLVTDPGPTFSGVLTVQQTALGLGCVGTGTMTGTATSSTITLDVPSIAGSPCQWSSNNHFALHR